MIDTCDPEIASWSEDGNTFIVKDTTRFGQTIVPLYFKHRKFTSFVRQLNFYGFRKIKYSDNLRIDKAEEEKTKNYWRFKHASFRRGRRDLLIEIKRNGSATASSPPGNTAIQGTDSVAVLQGAVVADTPTSGGAVAAVASTDKKPEQEVTVLQSEVLQLKQRIDGMAKNITDLTSQVHNIELNEEDELESVDAKIRTEVHSAVEKEVRKEVKKEVQKELDERSAAASNEVGGSGSKRKKTNAMEAVTSLALPTIPIPTSPMAHAHSIKQEPELDEHPHKLSSTSSLMPLQDLPMADLSMPDWESSDDELDVLAPLSREPSVTSQVPLVANSFARQSSIGGSMSGDVSDTDFCEEIFQAFAGDDQSMSMVTETVAVEEVQVHVEVRAPSPEPVALLPQQQSQSSMAPDHVDSYGYDPMPTSNDSDSNVDPAVMKRIEDSLATLPRDMHDLVADRLIDAIANSRPAANALLDSSCGYSGTCSSEVPMTPSKEERDNVVQDDNQFLVQDSSAADEVEQQTAQQQAHEISIPLAVATLTSILAQYGVSVECRRASEQPHGNANFPVAVPIHA